MELTISREKGTRGNTVDHSEKGEKSRRWEIKVEMRKRIVYRARL